MFMGPKIPTDLPQIKDGYMPFRGGLNQETSPWEMPIGELQASENYEEAIQGGYIDIEGFERFDGRPAPSDASYATYPVTISGSVEVDDTITGAVSGATAVVVAVVTTETPNYLVVTKINGTFTDTEDLEVSASVEASAAGDLTVDGAATPKLHAQYRNLAADAYRADIAAVPGEGSVLGVEDLNGTEYAWRNASGGATAALYQATASGWTLVDLGNEIDFTSGGTTAIAEDDVVEGAIGGATATVERVILTSGTWAGGDAAGRLILSGQTGTFQAEDLDVQGGAANVATVAGDSTAITLLPSGSYEFDKSNFADPGGSPRLYGVDGVNRGFEFDGSVFVPINTGMTNDAPEHVQVHDSQLWYSYGAQLQHSGIITPYIWTLLSGGDTLVVDDQITALEGQPGQQGQNPTMSVFQRNRIHHVYGSPGNYQLIRYRREVGAYAGTVKTLTYSVYLDDRGITDLQTTQAFGNFRHATLSSKIQEYVNANRGLAVHSCIVRNKSQYRLFFSDGQALYVTFTGRRRQPPSFMPIRLTKAPSCITSVETAAGGEKILFGASDGFVYRLDKGTSFDGEDITAFMDLHFTNDDIRYLKAFKHSATIEARGSGYAEIDFGYRLGYGDSDEYVQPADQTAEIGFATTARWDGAGLTWDTLFWDGATLVPTTGLELDGEAENISFSILKSSDYFAPVRMTGIHYHYLLRRQMR